MYKIASQAYKENDYVRAKGKFMEVEQIYPDYKSTRKYLERIDKDIAMAEEQKWAKQQKEFEDTVRKQRREERREGRQLELARATVIGAENNEDFDDNMEVAETDRRGAPLKIAGIENPIVKRMIKQRKQRFSQETEKKYDEAVNLYNANKFIEAKLKFIEVDSLSPDYKATPQYLRRIDDEITKQQSSEQDWNLSKTRMPSVQSQETRPFEVNGRREAIEQALQGFESTALQKSSSYSSVAPSVSAPSDEKNMDWEQQINRRKGALREQRKEVQK